MWCTTSLLAIAVSSSCAKVHAPCGYEQCTIRRRPVAALPLLSLRGGASSTYPSPVRYDPTPMRYYESGERMSSPMPSQRVDPTVEEPQMSDAEKVYVLQQFQRPAVRLAFLRKVYGIVFAQLLLTVGVVYALRTVPGLLPTLLRRLGGGVALLPIIPLLLLSLGGAKSALAYPLLAAFTALEGVAIGAFTFAFPTLLVLQAAGATAVATGGLSLYALTTKRDFTAAGGILFSSLLGIMSLGLLQLFTGPLPMVQSARLAFGLVLFCGYLVVNTQLMMGGNKKRQLRPSEHIMAAVTLYTDIINIFLHILASMARNQSD